MTTISARLAAIAIVAFLVNALISPVVLKLAHRYEWYDHVNARKIHTDATPRLGGVGIVLAFVSASVFGILVVMEPPLVLDAPWSGRALIMVAAGLAVMHWLGLYDDFVNLPAVFKFIIQIAAASLVAFSGVLLQTIEIPLLGIVSLPLWLAIPATVLWIVSVSNAMNLIDGADGLAGGVALISALFMGVIALGQGNALTALLAWALVGSLAGFLLFNAPPARIFMGDGGSLSLGFILATLPLVGLERATASGAVSMALLPVLTLLFVPITDTVLAITRRIVRGLPVHAADREHIHHRLIDRGFTGVRLLAIVYSGMVLLGITAMAWYTVPPLVSTGITLAVWVGALATIIVMGRATPTA